MTSQADNDSVKADTSLVSLDKVSKVYSQGQVDALVEVSADFGKGEFVALLGASGCGKSTLLNLIGCIDRPTSGTVSISGVPVSALSDTELTDIRRDSIGFVFQFFNLLPTLTVEENVNLPLRIGGRSKSEIKEKTESMLESVGLVPRSSFFPSQLSGGEMQRAAVARALVHEPSIVLADEPTGNLDSENGIKVLELLKMVNEKKNLTIIMATHSVEAASYAGRVLRLRDGRIIVQ
ncbi:MAG: ABC transporter ATP-binding protein [Candidatus Obscuribacterales bacterium]|nr:ABC transporter ATP-binding protein [Candidatus Obscuribacterales bacterium]